MNSTTHQESSITAYRDHRPAPIGRTLIAWAVLALSPAFGDPDSTIRYEQRSFYPYPAIGWTSHSSPEYGWQAYEDFTLPNDEVLTKIRWTGHYNNSSTPSAAPNTTSWSISIHIDDGGQPGAQLFGQNATPGIDVQLISVRPTARGDGQAVDLRNFEAQLSTPFTAQAGTTYWISIFSNGPDFSTLFVWDSGMPNRAETRRQLDANGHCWSIPAGSNTFVPTDRVLGDLAMVLVGRPVDDADQDGMRDSWETEHGLDPTLDDSQGDPDADGLVNLDEFEQQSDPQDPDTDGDGLSDEVESNRGTYLGSHDTGTSPILADTDRDGLPDNTEVPLSENSETHPTDPNLSDTDQDRYDDGVEIGGGFDPNDPASLPALNVLGIGAGALLGGDLTDPEDDAAASGSAGHNAIIEASATGDPLLSSRAHDAFDNRLGLEADHLCCVPNSWPWWSWVSATFAEPIVLTHFTMASASGLTEQNPQDFEIQGSNDGGLTWDTIFVHVTRAPGESPFSAAFQVLRFDAGTHYALPPAYRSFRFFVEHAEQEFSLGELEYFGRRHTTRMTKITPGEDQVAVSWSSIPQVSYQVERSVDLNTWSPVQSDIPSQGASTSFTDANLPTPTPPALFYRVRKE